MASSPGFTAGLAEALWTDEDLYVFNGKRVSSKGITGGLGEEREEEGGDNSQHTCGESGRQRLGRDLPLLSWFLSPLVLFPRYPPIRLRQREPVKAGCRGT